MVTPRILGSDATIPFSSIRSLDKCIEDERYEAIVRYSLPASFPSFEVDKQSLVKDSVFDDSRLKSLSSLSSISNESSLFRSYRLLNEKKRETQRLLEFLPRTNTHMRVDIPLDPQRELHYTPISTHLSLLVIIAHAVFSSYSKSFRQTLTLRDFASRHIHIICRSKSGSSITLDLVFLSVRRGDKYTHSGLITLINALYLLLSKHKALRNVMNGIALLQEDDFKWNADSTSILPSDCMDGSEVCS